jgi:hypothetical protein
MISDYMPAIEAKKSVLLKEKREHGKKPQIKSVASVTENPPCSVSCFFERPELFLLGTKAREIP